VDDLSFFAQLLVPGGSLVAPAGHSLVRLVRPREEDDPPDVQVLSSVGFAPLVRSTQPVEGLSTLVIGKNEPLSLQVLCRSVLRTDGGLYSYGSIEKLHVSEPIIRFLNYGVQCSPSLGEFPGDAWAHMDSSSVGMCMGRLQKHWRRGTKTGCNNRLAALSSRLKLACMRAFPPPFPPPKQHTAANCNFFSPFHRTYRRLHLGRGEAHLHVIV